ncbi:cytochrome P450 [Fusarium redolens]|uniref:Cytochrome P450 n=1 Tax=Fusarium redolens TaxID=48865 RepID=A0A9P9R814_FUSRE|nr:cytochrome P450 [Fusarium redolens]KAH7269227.1 cytochrome P450 [Fusarium redolens]
MGYWFQCFVFDVIGLITYSKRPGFLDKCGDVGSIIKTIDNEMAYFAFVGQGTGHTYLMNFTKNTVIGHQSRLSRVATEDAEANKVPLDFFSKFFRKHVTDPGKFTMYHVLAGCASSIVRPQTLQRLRDEIQQNTGSGGMTRAQSQGMPYLQAVTKEASRLHAAVALPMERVVPQGGVEICGYYFPGGNYVSINNWVYHRSKAIFGQDAEGLKF